MTLRVKSIIIGMPLILTAAFFLFRDGPYGPPIFTDAVGGDFIIMAPVWFGTDEAAIKYASFACLGRYFNASAHKVELTKPSYFIIGDNLRIQLKPRWITVYCAP